MLPNFPETILSPYLDLSPDQALCCPLILAFSFVSNFSIWSFLYLSLCLYHWCWIACSYCSISPLFSLIASRICCLQISVFSSPSAYLNPKQQQQLSSLAHSSEFWYWAASLHHVGEKSGTRFGFQTFCTLLSVGYAISNYSECDIFSVI